MSNDQDTVENEPSSPPAAEPAAEPRPVAEPAEGDAPPEPPPPSEPAGDAPLAEAVNAPSRAGIVIALIALIIGIAAAAGIGGLALLGKQEAQQLRSEIGAMRTGIQTGVGDAREVAREARAAVATVASEAANLESRISAQDQVLTTQRSELNTQATRQQALEDSVSQLSHLIQGGRNVWQLGEVEHLLLVANDRLQLQADVDGARRALLLADQRLAEMAEPGLFDVRNAIAREITALDAVPAIDIHALALKLGSLVERADALPLKQTARPEPDHGSVSLGQPDESVLERGRRTLTTALQALVSVRHDVPRQEALLPPEQGFFLRQNLRLQLESARLAVLRRDSANLRVSLRQAESWLGRYFETGNAGVISMLRTVQELQTQDLSPSLPRISGSLTALREALSAE